MDELLLYDQNANALFKLINELLILNDQFVQHDFVRYEIKIMIRLLLVKIIKNGKIKIMSLNRNLIFY